MTNIKIQKIENIPSPAKLNLFLHITGIRENGYHELQSAFILINYCDNISYETNTSGQITRHDINIKLPSDDLITRAAKALQKESGCKLGAHIKIQKNIPAEAGMGGGSSNAATTLLVLNHLWQTNLKTEQLTRIGEKLGADVPFFIYGKAAWIEGIGEKITPLALTQEQLKKEIFVIKPPQGLSTAKIFSAPDLQRNTKLARISDFIANPYEFGHNDLQPVAQKYCPQIALATKILEKQNIKARMTGSGSALFAPLPENSDYEQIKKIFVAELKKSGEDENRWILQKSNIFDENPVIRLIDDLKKQK